MRYWLARRHVKTTTTGSVMPIEIKNRFRFDQRKIALHEIREWRAGLCLAMLARFHLHVVQHGLILPVSAFVEARDFVETLRSSIPAGFGPLTREGSQLVGTIVDMQDRFAFICAGGSEREYDFDDHGMALIGLKFQNRPMGFSGQVFHTTSDGWRRHTANHIGLLVWALGSAFILDPNYGGIHFTWQEDGLFGRDLPTAVDHVLVSTARQMMAMDWPDHSCMTRAMVVYPDLLTLAIRDAIAAAR